MPDPTVMDAVNEALGLGGSSNDDAANTGTDSDTDHSAADASAGEAEGSEAPADGTESADEGTEEGENAAGEGEGAGKGGAANAGRERNADGTFKKPAEAAAAGKKTGDGESAGAKKPDAVNDPIPKELKQETQERIRTLINTTKEITQDRDRVKQDFDYMVQGVQATGASPEQYGETLSWLAMFNSNDPAQQTKALELVENVADRLATLLGKERAVGDPLANHADLKEAVQKGQVTAQYAKEIARVRNSSNFRNELTTTARTQQQEQEQAQQALTTAKSDLSALEVTLRAKDPLYEQKKAVLVPMLQPIFQQLSPDKWRAAFQSAYDKVKVTAPVKKVAPTDQPMRAGKNPAGGQKTAATSMLDAVNGALAGMR